MAVQVNRYRLIRQVSAWQTRQSVHEEYRIVGNDAHPRTIGEVLGEDAFITWKSPISVDQEMKLPGTDTDADVRLALADTRASNRRPATQSQVKAIHSIARNRRIDIAQFLDQRFHVHKPDDLTLKEASQVIDELKENVKPEGRT